MPSDLHSCVMVSRVNAKTLGLQYPSKFTICTTPFFSISLGYVPREIEDCLRNFLVLGERGNEKYYESRAHVEFMPQDKNPAPYLFQFSL